MCIWTWLPVLKDIHCKQFFKEPSGSEQRFLYISRNGDRDDAPNVAIVITDGVSNINSRRTIPDAELARDFGIHIYAVGIGLSDTRELDAIASEPASENSFNVADFDELSGLGAKIFTSTCVGK